MSFKIRRKDDCPIACDNCSSGETDENPCETSEFNSDRETKDLCEYCASMLGLGSDESRNFGTAMNILERRLIEKLSGSPQRT